MAYTRWIHWICWGCQPISFALLQDNFCVSQTSVEYLYESITGRTRKAFGGSKQEPLQDRIVMTMVSSKQGQIFPILDWFEMSDGTCQLSIRNMIGGANILIRRATGKMHDYHDRNGFYTTILNAVCRKSLAFIDLYAGFPGKVHNVRVFSNHHCTLQGGTHLSKIITFLEILHSQLLNGTSRLSMIMVILFAWIQNLNKIEVPLPFAVLLRGLWGFDFRKNCSF